MLDASDSDLEDNSECSVSAINALCSVYDCNPTFDKVLSKQLSVKVTCVLTMRQAIASN